MIFLTLKSLSFIQKFCNSLYRHVSIISSLYTLLPFFNAINHWILHFQEEFNREYNESNLVTAFPENLVR